MINHVWTTSFPCWPLVYESDPELSIKLSKIIQKRSAEFFRLAVQFNSDSPIDAAELADQGLRLGQRLSDQL